jgi:PPK2 family polyphosphate:nucleotide phosphotransferase
VNPERPIKPGSKVDLSDFPTEAPNSLTKEKAAERLEKLSEELDELEELLYAAGQTGLLIVLQGRDTSGKDGLIRHLLSVMNVQSCRVQGFKVPTAEELSHDFLWRIHAAAPPLGGVTVFNRSHYEDVLVVRVHDLAPEKVWRSRYEHINAFEKLLADSGAVILKFYLHISKKEQEERLLEREQDPVKAWKLSVGDWKEREYWDDYTKAYEDALEKCSTEHAPWYVVPADNKWYRNLFVTERILEALRPCRKEWMKHLEEVGEKAKAEIEAYRASQAEK